MQDEIRIEGLRVRSRIGVPDEERASEQELSLHVAMRPVRGLSGLGDAVENTVDYDEVCRRVRELCADGERRLLETLAEEIAGFLLGEYPLAAVDLEVRKFIIPECDYVSVAITRERKGD